MEYRALVAVVLSILILVGFQFFFRKELPKTPPPTTQPETTIQRPEPATQKKEHAPVIPNVLPAKKAESLPTPSPDFKPRDITVETDLFKTVFTEHGGAVKHFFLKKYRSELAVDSPPVDLINVTSYPYPLQTGVSEGKEPIMTPVFCSADKEGLVLNEGQKEGKLNFSCRLENGTTLVKTFTFKNGSYLMGLGLASENHAPFEGVISLYNRPRGKGSSYVFEGPEYFQKGVLEEVDLKDQNLAIKGPVTWTGFGDNYFLCALIPSSQDKSTGTSFEKGKRGTVVTSSLNYQAQDGQGQFLVYLGPKDMNELKKAGYNLSHSINFGYFDIIAKPLLYVLKFSHKFIHNYGVAIILLTILIKIIFWPLSHKSAQSMKTMQKIQPKLQKLKEKYGDDKTKFNQEMLQLYKTYKVNPASGCLPMIIQIPVFFALYKVLLQCIELRHAPFALWINDLSAPDRLMIPGIAIPYLGGLPILTILMGVSMYFQQKMTPTSMDPTQAKVMQFLPVLFIFLFISFPSGLVLYWLVNNVLTISQQYYTNKFTK